MAGEISLNQNVPLVSVVMPCLNEEEAIGTCIGKIQAAFTRANIQGEIVVCDNGSTDCSVSIESKWEHVSSTNQNADMVVPI
jgi:glycosyltransferase involved in cell wall biosynthesis